MLTQVDCDPVHICSAVPRVTAENVLQRDTLKRVDKSKWNTEECPEYLPEDR